MLRASTLVRFAMSLWVCTPALLPSTYEPTSSYSACEIAGWQVRVSARLEAAPDLRKKVVELLAAKLFDIGRVVPAKALERLKRVPIWLELDDVRSPCACFHPSKDWLVQMGYNPEKAGTVEISNAQNFLSWSLDQPWMLLHELAHGYYFLALAERHAEITDSHAAAVKSGKYDSVLHFSGVRKRAYALENPAEYFAELSEAYFGTNDFFPFVRAELKDHDPTGFALLERLWSSDGPSGGK